MTTALTMSRPRMPDAAATAVPPTPEATPRRLRRLLIALALAALFWLGHRVAGGDLYTPGSDLGYNLGLAGGLLMLALLIYPLRKRIPALARLGKMNTWFKFHMVAGIGGPVLILFHSTFKLGSLNGRVAFYAMLLVACSGIVGRFLYRHVHRGLYGRRMTLDEAHADLKASLEHLSTVFALQADIAPRLLAFQERAAAPLPGLGRRFWRFVTLRRQGRQLGDAIRHDVKFALTRLRREQKLPRHELALNYRIARDQILDYIDAVVQTSQLAAWDRLFSLWHVIHIPFLYLLVFSGIVHVVAVHMY